MSRVGKQPIPIPSGVTVQISTDAVEVKGPKGTLRQALPPGVTIEMADGQLEARPVRDERALRKFHGLARSLVANAVTGRFATTRPLAVDVELTGTLTRGQTVGDELGRWGKEPNVDLLCEVDAEGFIEHLLTTLRTGLG